jgi:hypothetical protein
MFNDTKPLFGDEDDAQQPAGAKKPKDLSSDQMLAMTAITLGTSLLGGLLGGKDGAVMGLGAGAGAAGAGAGGIMERYRKEEEARIKADADEAARKQKLEGALEFEREKAKLKPEKVNDTKNALGQVINADTGEIIDANKTPPKAVAAGKGAAGPKPPDAIKGEDKLRNEWTKHDVTKRTTTMRAAFNAVNSTSNNAAGHMSLLFQYMKMLDPGSTVREGEFATAEQARGVDESILGQYNKAVEGKRLTDAQVAQFKGEAKKLLDAQQLEQAKIDAYYESLAKGRDLSPSNVVRRDEAAPAPAAAPKFTPEQIKALKEEKARRQAAAGAK